MIAGRETAGSIHPALPICSYATAFTVSKRAAQAVDSPRTFNGREMLVHVQPPSMPVLQQRPTLSVPVLRAPLCLPWQHLCPTRGPRLVLSPSRRTGKGGSTLLVPDLAPVNSACALGGWLIACAWEEGGERGREIEVTQMCGQVGGWGRWWAGDGVGVGIRIRIWIKKIYTK